MPVAAAQQLREVLEKFEGRHRNLLDIFEARATDIRDSNLIDIALVKCDVPVVRRVG
jgi:hypothetical protein